MIECMKVLVSWGLPNSFHYPCFGSPQCHGFLLLFALFHFFFFLLLCHFFLRSLYLEPSICFLLPFVIPTSLCPSSSFPIHHTLQFIPMIFLNRVPIFFLCLYLKWPRDCAILIIIPKLGPTLDILMTE